MIFSPEVAWQSYTNIVTQGGKIILKYKPGCFLSKEWSSDPSPKFGQAWLTQQRVSMCENHVWITSLPLATLQAEAIAGPIPLEEAWHMTLC